MNIFYGIEQLEQFVLPVLTIGTFDGVHQGHKSILQKVVSEAQLIKGTSVLITFNPHPRKLIFPNESLKLLSTLDERLELVANCGIDVTVVVPFTLDFAAQSAQDYIQKFIVKLFKPKQIIIGYDHRFGHDRTGDINMLQANAREYAYEVKEISAQLIDAAAISSTQVRKALTEGKVELAAQMLGVYYSLSGKVVFGAQLGRTIGYPTANIVLSDYDKLVPKNGVYAVLVKVNQHLYHGMLNIGINPTVSQNNELKIEVNIFGFDEDIYGQDISISFVSRIRDEQKFMNLDSLKYQLNEDKQSAKNLLSQINKAY